MAQDSSLYIVDVYVSNEGEPESALELTILRFLGLNRRPVVYVHTYIQPTCSAHLIRWNDAAKKGMPRELFENNRWPTLDEILDSDYLRDKFVVCFCPNFEPYQSLLVNCSARYSILNMWQDVFAGNEDVSSITDYKLMLEYIGLPTKDASNTRYTPLMKRTHALLAICLFLFSCKSRKIQPRFAEGDGEEAYRAFWPLQNVPQPWYDRSASDFGEIEPNALSAYFSERLPDYIDWANICIYKHDWVFGRDRHDEVRLKQQEAMIQFIFSSVWQLQTKIMVLAFYSLYENRTDYARTIALHQGILSSLPQSVKEDFLAFIVRHLDDFLTSSQKRSIIGALMKQQLYSRSEVAAQTYDFDALKKQEAENGYTFVQETISSNHNIVCYKEISTPDAVLYRCFIMQGSVNERNECIDFINLKLRELIKDAHNPMCSMWFSPELRQWICYITGFSWEELTAHARPQDSDKLTDTRHQIVDIIKDVEEPFRNRYKKMVSDMVDTINQTSDEETRRGVFSFLGVTYEILVEKTTENMSLFERIKRIF